MWLKSLLWILASANILFGAAALFFPQKVATWVNLGLLSESAIGEIRAVYGGLPAALGILMAGALFRPTGREWLLALSFCFAGLALGRVVSLFVEGLSTYTLATGGFEALSAVLLLYAYRNLT